MENIENTHVPDFTGNLDGSWKNSSSNVGTGPDYNFPIRTDSIFCNIFSSLGESSKLSLDLIARKDQAGTSIVSQEIKGKITLNTSSIDFESPVLSPLYDILLYNSFGGTYSAEKIKTIEFYAYITNASGKFRNLSNNIIVKFTLLKNSADDFYNNFSISLMNLGSRSELPMSTPPLVKVTDSCCA